MSYLALTLILLISTPLLAAPVVLFDQGPTEPTHKYKMLVQGFDIPDFGRLWAEEASLNTNDALDPLHPSNWLPLTTTKLTPGDVVSRRVVYNYLSSPVCVIGSDDRSLHWVRRYHKQLLENNVLCWLVQSNDIDELQKTIDALDGITMSPSNGDAIADHFSISHYPILITPRFIEQ